MDNQQPNDQQRNSHEKSVDDNSATIRRLVIPTLMIDTDSTLLKLSPRLSTRPIRTSLLSEIRRRDALSTVPLDNCDELLEIRSTKQYIKSVSNSNAESSVITINVSGDRFQTYLHTLQLYPNTLLGDANKRKRYWNSKTEEYFFDRHRACFEAILYYYQSNGRLRRPDLVPIDTFLEEISFFELGEDISTEVREAENIKKVEHIQMPRMLWRRYIWFYLEFPQHSVMARAINLISTLFTILSCIALAVESLPQYTNHWDDICKERANLSTNATYVPRCSALFYSPFFIIQTVCVVFFSVEFLLRLISTPSYRRFILSFFNWVDLSAILPYYIFLGIQLSDRDIGLNTNVILCIRLLRILRFSRIFKIYLVFRRLKSLRVLSATIKESLVDFAVMITILTLLAFLFGAAIYFAEQTENGDVFDSIPRATYWGIITLTGVGYGDMTPITAAGRIITCLCALCGPATMGMLVSVLVDRYQRVYNRKMYISEPEISSVDFDINNGSDDEIKTPMSSERSSRRGKFSEAKLHHEKTKHDHHQSPLSYSNKLQFIVSFKNKKNDKDSSAVDHVVTIMKRKLTEAISVADVDVDLKLIDHNSKELWTMSTFQSPKCFGSNVTRSTNIDDIEQSDIHTF